MVRGSWKDEGKGFRKSGVKKKGYPWLGVHGNMKKRVSGRVALKRRAALGKGLMEI